MTVYFHMAAYYADDVEHPKKPGELAIQTWAVCDSVRQLDVDIASRRPDIGHVSTWTTNTRHGR